MKKGERASVNERKESEARMKRIRTSDVSECAKHEGASSSEEKMAMMMKVPPWTDRMEP